MYEKLIETGKDETPDSYWGYRKEHLFVERTHLRFRYLFRLIDFAIALYAVLLGSTVVVAEWNMEREIDYGSLFFALVGLSAYVWLRRLPVRPPEDSTTSEGNIERTELNDVEQDTAQPD